MSASIRPTRKPILTNAAAKLTARVVLPTPPLPDPTAMMFATPGSVCMCPISIPLVSQRRVPFALALLLALFATPSSVMVAAFVFFRFGFQWRAPHAASLTIDGNEGKIRRCDMAQGPVDGLFHPHLDAHFH